ncbi:hypothetical protein ACFPER_13615 [Agromyces aurantiacus]|uniref:Di-and tripeptidase n=1 Tax=Agromyces aurantiacus TaxID=165814 RepID=A0ABV9R7S6_9MICO|nr:hypothetical protein [Agromyces aurantiacus]MBM7505270.1 hypothetical protein [Agromyces aurantiacus]
MSERVHNITSMRSGAPREGEPGSDAADRAAGLERGFDRLLSIQRPIVVAHLRGIRRNHPTATPDELVRILERRYLTAVTTGGAAVGATAVVPGIGTGVTLALSGVETAGFLEATALFAQSVAEVHGMHVENPDRARALVMTLLMGREGVDLVRQFAAQATGGSVSRNAYWGEVITNGLPKAVMGTVADRLRRVFVKQYAVRGGAGIIGRAIPFGIGAAIGGVGNHMLGRRVLQQSRLAFGGAPQVLPAELEPREPGVPAGVRAARRGAAVTTALASATSRGLRSASRAIGRRRDADAGAGTGTGAGTGAIAPEADDPSAG